MELKRNIYELPYIESVVLIAPNGIETTKKLPCKRIAIFVLIAPNGIETLVLTISKMLAQVLIAPNGIETRCNIPLHY